MFAHRHDDTRKIFRMVDRFYQNQPISQRHPKTPAKTLWIEFPTWDGFYSAQTAGSAGAGRGLGMSRLHLSEAAFYSDLDGLHTGLHDTIAEVQLGWRYMSLRISPPSLPVERKNHGHATLAGLLKRMVDRFYQHQRVATSIAVLRRV